VKLCLRLSFCRKNERGAPTLTPSLYTSHYCGEKRKEGGGTIFAFLTLFTHYARGDEGKKYRVPALRGLLTKGERKTIIIKREKGGKEKGGEKKKEETISFSAAQSFRKCGKVNGKKLFTN